MTGTVLYSRELFDRLCDGIAQNLSVTDAAKSVGVTKQCLYKWLLPTHHEHEYNRAAFAVAKSLQADYAFDNLSRIAAPVPGEDAVSVAARRLQYDAEKWRTSKMDSKYSDKTEIKHEGELKVNATHTLSEPIAYAIEQLRAAATQASDAGAGAD